VSSQAQSSPEQMVNELFDALDRLDIDAIESLFDDEPQGVDELSGGWRRGREALHEYFSQITSAGLADVRSTVTDVHTKNWGDTAVVTLVLDQTYTLEGEQHAIHAPSTPAAPRDSKRSNATPKRSDAPVAARLDDRS
jgi:ketosteroid isomerase-like protein